MPRRAVAYLREALQPKDGRDANIVGCRGLRSERGRALWRREAKGDGAQLLGVSLRGGVVHPAAPLRCSQHGGCGRRAPAALVAQADW